MNRALALALYSAFSFFVLFGCINETARRQSFIDSNPGISDVTKKKILDGTIIIGMTKEEVVASWGKPVRVNKNISKSGVREQWVYNKPKSIGGGRLIFIPWKYLYFEKKKLTNIQSLD